jgi:hypothetical protein
MRNAEVSRRLSGVADRPRLWLTSVAADRLYLRSGQSAQRVDAEDQCDPPLVVEHRCGDGGDGLGFVGGVVVGADERAVPAHLG